MCRPLLIMILISRHESFYHRVFGAVPFSFFYSGTCLHLWVTTAPRQLNNLLNLCRPLPFQRSILGASFTTSLIRLVLTALYKLLLLFNHLQDSLICHLFIHPFRSKYLLYKCLCVTSVNCSCSPGFISGIL